MLGWSWDHLGHMVVPPLFSNKFSTTKHHLVFSIVHLKKEKEKKAPLSFQTGKKKR